MDRSIKKMKRVIEMREYDSVDKGVTEAEIIFVID